MAEDPEDTLGDEIVNTALDEDASPDMTFGSALNQITLFLDDVPEDERSSRRKKLMCVLERKFSAMMKVNDQSNLEDADRRATARAFADKIAGWMEAVIVEAEQRVDSHCTGLETPAGSTAASEGKSVSLQVEFSDVYEVLMGSGSSLAVENIVRPRAPSENRSTMTEVMAGLRAWASGCKLVSGPAKEGEVDLHQWADWLDDVMKLTEDWASWINRTVAQTRDQAEAKKTAGVEPVGEEEQAGLDNWKSRVTEEGATFSKVNERVQKTAEEWRKTFGEPSTKKE